MQDCHLDCCLVIIVAVVLICIYIFVANTDSPIKYLSEDNLIGKEF